MYSFYCKLYNRTNHVVSKLYFEKHAYDNLKMYMDDENMVTSKWWS